MIETGGPKLETVNLTSDDEVHRQLRVQGRRMPARTIDGLDETMRCWFSDDGL